jgi:hypothetical protein
MVAAAEALPGLRGAAFRNCHVNLSVVLKGSGGGTIAVATARPRIQIGPTLRTEAGTIFPTDYEMQLRRERQLLADDFADVDVHGPLRQRVKIRIVGGVGVGAEDRRVDVDIYGVLHFHETPAALAPDHPVQMSPPEVLPGAGGLELPPHRDRAGELEPEPLKRRIVRGKLPDGPDRALLQIPGINAQHSLIF